MRPVTARFTAAVASSHEIVVTVDVLQGETVIAENLAVVDGAVTLDRTAVIRGRLNSIALAEPLHLPTSPASILSPYGYQLRVRRGVRYADNTTELVGLGVYPIQTSGADAQTLLTVADALDRAQTIADARLEDDYSITAGTNYATAIRTLIESGFPGGVAPFPFSFISTAYTTPPQLVLPAQSDRWAEAVKMARDIGCELYFDGDGTCALRLEPTADDDPVGAFAEGPGGVLVAASSRLERALVYNRVIATSSNASLSTVYRGVATDSDPASPTYYDGPFGRKPLFYSSPFLASDAQATSAAQARLLSRLGVARSVDLSAVPNPAYEPSDVATITNTALDIDTTHIIDVCQFGLSADRPMVVASRAKQEAN